MTTTDMRAATTAVCAARGRLGALMRHAPHDTAAIDAARENLLRARAARLRALADELDESTMDGAA